MSFTTPNGTYGATLPVPVEQMQEMNARNTAAIRAGQKAMGMQALVLITVGRKSGKTHETPVAYFRTPDGALLIIASAAGAANHPAWYFNLAATDGAARAVLDGEEFPVQATELHGDERERYWRQITAASAGFAQYEQLTDRQIPVIRLDRRPE